MIGGMTADVDRPGDADRPADADHPSDAGPDRLLDVGRPADSTPDPRALTRAHFDHVVRATTRWSDNDMYGHLNNAVYYELFDSAINGWLITGAGVDVMALPELGVVAESGCRYFRELECPRPLDVGVRVERIGRSSITYALGLFDAEAAELAALGHWVHVYVDRTSRATVPVPSSVRDLLRRAEQTRS
jgi:acyl-CoA thioester hydrolase